MYLLLELTLWEKSKVNGMPGLQVTKPKDGSIGFLSVYSTKEEAEKAAKQKGSIVKIAFNTSVLKEV